MSLSRMKRKTQRSTRPSTRKPNTQTEQVVTGEAPQYQLTDGDTWSKDFWTRDAPDEEPIEDLDDLQLTLQSGCLKNHIPTCPETQLTQRFVSSCGRLQMHIGETHLVPSYIGHSQALGLAARAFISAIEYQKLKQSIPRERAYQIYGQALTALRQTIDFSDKSLITVALLAMYEGIMRMHTPAQFSHRYGIAKIMLSRQKSPSGPNELERVLLYADWDRRLRAPVALGVVSPFEDPYWWNAPPRSRITPPLVVKMRMVTNQLFIRLPRLVMYTRSLRSGNTEVREELRHLVNELLELQNSEAENFLLHGVKIVPTKDQWDIPIAKFSFEYQILQQMTFATHYWYARLLLMQLCFQLLALPGAIRVVLSRSEDDLKAETKHMLTNIFMSYQYAKSLSMGGHICIAQPLIASYGACTIMERWQDLPISSLKTWIVLRLNDSWGRWGRSLSSKDLEDINTCFSGGPLVGMLPKTYEDEKILYGLPNDIAAG